MLIVVISVYYDMCQVIKVIALSRLTIDQQCKTPMQVPSIKEERKRAVHKRIIEINYEQASIVPLVIFAMGVAMRNGTALQIVLDIINHLFGHEIL